MRDHERVDPKEPNPDPLDAEEPRARNPLVLRALVIAGVVAIAGFLLLRPSGSDTSAVPDTVRMPRLQAPGDLALGDLRGTPLVVNFWASWCDPCRREMPLLEEIARSRDDVEVVGIDVQDSKEAALEFLDTLELTYPLVQDLDQAVFKPLHRGADLPDFLPQTYFITADGEVLLDGPAGPKLGEYDGIEELQEAVDALVAASQG